MKRPRMNTFTESEFWNRATLNEASGCFEWIRGVGSTTYGRIMFKGKLDSPHRVAYMLTVGEISEGLYICHNCDNKLCINPMHLYAGTNRDNQLDAVERGQHRHINPQDKKTHCPQGHIYDTTNGRGNRICSICASYQQKTYRLRKKLEAVCA